MTSTIENGPAKVDVVQAGLLNIDPSARLTTLSISEDGTHGVVLWKRDQPREQRFVVHRWATHYTDGQPVPAGVMFWSGGYYATLEEASQDMRERA